MPRAALLGLLLAATGIAGCLTSSQPLDATGLADLSGLSAPVYDLGKDLVKAPLEVLAYDGKRLDTWVYRPDAPEGERVPAILIISPYFANQASNSRTDNVEELASGPNWDIVNYFLPRGYAVVMNSVRGTGYSEGCFTIGGPTEREDINTLIEAVVAEPWSNGAVAVYGKSYVGTTANEALLTGNPALKTIVPISAISDFYKYNFINGVPINPQGYSFNYYYERDVAIVPPYGDPTFETVHLGLEEAQCSHADTQGGGFWSAATGDKHAYWQARDYNPEASRAKASVFLVHGLQDWNVKPDHLLPWMDLLQDEVPVKAWLGQWAHDYPNNNRHEKSWSRGDWNATLLRWFDHWLKGIDTGILQEPLVDVQDDLGAWRKEARWPPARAPEARFYLAQGSLSDAPGTGVLAWRDTGDDVKAPPSEGAMTYAFLQTEPLADDLRIAGMGTLRLRLEHDMPAGTVAATLWRIAPNGTAERINFGFYDLRHRNGLESAEPVQPGMAFDLEVPLFPQDDLVPAGFRLGLTLAGNDPRAACMYSTVSPPPLPPGVPLDWPAPVYLASGVCDVRTEGFRDPGPSMKPLPSLGTTMVHLGADSVLTLPVVDTVAPFQPPLEFPPEEAS